MYFAISRTNKQFFSQTFPNSTDWDFLRSQIKGETVVELFQNEKLEPVNFEEYFVANYAKTK